MSAKDVYRPSESEPKCPEILVNKQKMTSQALRDQEAAGSNPVTPMRKTAKTLSFGGLLIFAFSGLTTCRTIDRSTFGETIFLFCSVPEFRGAGGRRRRGFSLSSAGENLPAERDFPVFTRVGGIKPLLTHTIPLLLIMFLGEAKFNI